MNEGLSKGFNPYSERRVIAKHIYSGNTLPLLIKLEKLIQISVFIFVHVKSVQQIQNLRKA